jgi:hypothetical protein
MKTLFYSLVLVLAVCISMLVYEKYGERTPLAYAQQPNYGGSINSYRPQANRKYLIDSLWVAIDDTFRLLPFPVDGTTITYINSYDTLTIDTTNTIATYDSVVNYVTNIVSDSSQYYYWRAVSHDHYPGYGNMVPWDYGQTNEDSVFICEFVDAATGKNYVEVKADTASSNEHHGYLHFEFTAPRDVSDITSTLFEIEYKMSISDTDSVGIRVQVFEGLTERYTSGTRLASATWTTLTIAKGDSTLSAIEEGDRFSLQIDFKTQAGGTSPTNWVSRVRERWW